MDDFDFEVRQFVYEYFVKQAQPPTLLEVARAFNVASRRMEESFQPLHHNHFFFLEPGETRIRMANPLSAIPTPFRVHTQIQSYWANCAWDMLGIPAMLHDDALIEAGCIGHREKVQLTVRDGKLEHNNELVHFAIPVEQWYDDLIET